MVIFIEEDKMLNDKMVYLDKRPVYYSPSSRTVLAESELEYKDRTDTSAYITFEMSDGTLLLSWTTQPWTVLGNVAICVNPSMEYSKIEYQGKKYITSTESLGLFGEYILLDTMLGSHLEGMDYVNTLTNTNGYVLADRFVKSGTGTGMVHLCPGHGEEDFDVCQKYGLVGDDLTDASGNIDGLFCLDDASENIIARMSEIGMLFKSESYTHSYPHDWRTGKPVYYKLTEQFFLTLDNIKKDAIAELDSVSFSAEKWKKRLASMVDSRSRWCLSRQRKWGFPLAVFLKDGKPFLNDKIEEHLLTLFQSHGSNIWFDTEVEDLLGFC